MIFVVEVECPHEHPNGGALYEYASETPPDAWFDHITRKVHDWVIANPQEFPKCDVCGERYSKHWRYVVNSLKCQTMEEAEAALAKVGRLVATERVN